MKYTISPDRTRLVITATKCERQELRDYGHSIQSDEAMQDFLEHLICNSELEWIDASETGDLTHAPMLARLEKQPCVSLNGAEVYTATVAERWAFLEYQTSSVLEVLRDNGEVVFVGGPL